LQQVIPERILHEHVPVDADKGEEKDTDIKVGVQHIAVAYAEHISIYPVFTGITSHQHRKSAQKR
jgi:hypothetical protein